ncbi:MAG: IS1634 family transposase [Erysipelotrichaceae bacterium]|nr:IS1634 family transposase [Erysipelotrichaceae bacterium]
MKLYYDRKSKDPTYFVQQGVRNGKKTTTKNIARIGKYSELLKDHEDPLQFAIEEVARYNKEFEKGNIEFNLTVKVNEKIINNGDIVSSSLCRNIGYFYLKDIYASLNLKEFFDKVCKGRKITYDPNLINMALVMLRVLDPGSKLYSQSKLSSLYGDVCFPYQHIPRFMDILEDNYDDYLSYLFDSSNNVIIRNTDVCYFDCTNFYFEKEEEDEDYYDDVTGELIKGLLKYGVSKEHRPNPIVQMGLFMDGDGIPLSMCINPGSDNESLSAVPSEKKLLKMFQGKDIIYCADAGLGYTNIRVFNDMGGRKFVVTQSIKKLSEVIKQAVFNDYDYKFSSTGKKASLEFMKTFDKNDTNNLDFYNGYIYKSIEVDSLVDLGLTEIKLLKNGNTRKVKSKGTLKQRIIVTYNRKMTEYQKTIRNRQIERAKSLLEHIDLDTYKKGPNDVTRFIKSSKKNSKTDYYLDVERIKEEEKYDGFYCVATNIFNEDERDIINIQKNRYKIEDCFRVLKTFFETRPIYHYKKERIKAHFLICYTALLIYRLLETKLDRNGTHYTPTQIITTIKNMSVLDCEGVFYKSCYTGSNVLDSLEQVFGLGINKTFYYPVQLNKIAKKL